MHDFMQRVCVCVRAGKLCTLRPHLCCHTARAAAAAPQVRSASWAPFVCSRGDREEEEEEGATWVCSPPPSLRPPIPK